ncbi:VOC family protein [Agromyces sp. SYSU K20354]|uniref:VOC family protein n=1 Tax=Agromyces cavernae TaxID=2898659 RepID=UPI001E540BC7|nr:VOC family protein [Agromyces cavernae]MCD2444155.1 VOC family protein [Agromyces cavernae]
MEDVEAARRFYEGLGFEPTATIPNHEGRPVLAILEGQGVSLIVDALEGLPFPDTDREQSIRRGPRGLGVVIGLIVENLEHSRRYFEQAGGELTSEPRDEPWGARVFSALDPFGFEWEISQPTTSTEPDNGAAATQQAWFGGSPDA